MILDNIRQAKRVLERAGLRILQAKSGHYKVYQGERLICVLSKNMNDARGWSNNLARIRRRTGLRLR